jgi:hypothetical protein
MNQMERKRLLRQIMWDYNIPVTDIEALFSGNKDMAGHYDRRTLFQKVLESYSWFTVLNIFTPEEINNMLTADVIARLRVPSLRKKYEFVKKRLQEVVPVTG